MNFSRAQRNMKKADAGPAAATKTTDPSQKPTPAAPAPEEPDRRRLYIIGAIVAAVVAVAAWWFLSGPSLPRGFAAGNGRLEANEIFVAAKYPGRVREILFNEGDMIDAGQVVARMDTTALEAQLRQAEAEITEAQDSRNVALAEVAVKEANFNYANKQYARSRGLVGSGAVSGQEAEIDQASMLASRAQLIGARAQATRSISSIDAAKATADRLRSEIKDAVLVAPIRARIQSRLTEPGEVLPAGGRVFSLIDLSDVYMYVFLPEAVTGKIPLGSEARIVLDAAKEYPIRAFVSYVSPTAQFTPKTVETAEERHNLTFRVKLQLYKDRLRDFEALVKSGLPGMGYVRWDTKAAWPETLQVKASMPKDLWQPTGSSGARP